MSATAIRTGAIVTEDEFHTLLEHIGCIALEVEEGRVPADLALLFERFIISMETVAAEADAAESQEERDQVISRATLELLHIQRRLSAKN